MGSLVVEPKSLVTFSSPFIHSLSPFLPTSHSIAELFVRSWLYLTDKTKAGRVGRRGSILRHRIRFGMTDDQGDVRVHYPDALTVSVDEGDLALVKHGNAVRREHLVLCVARVSIRVARVSVRMCSVC